MGCAMVLAVLGLIVGLRDHPVIGLVMIVVAVMWAHSAKRR